MYLKRLHEIEAKLQDTVSLYQRYCDLNEAPDSVHDLWSGRMHLFGGIENAVDKLKEFLEGAVHGREESTLRESRGGRK